MTVKKNPYRHERVINLLRDSIAKALTGTFADHYLEGAMISVTNISLSSDLKIATCYLMPLIDGRDDAQILIKAMRRHSALIRQQVNMDLKLKYSPELRFLIDPGFENLQKVATIIDDRS